MQRFRKLMHGATAALFIMCSAVLLALLLPTGWQVLSVQTGSMEPALSPGDLVVVRRQAAYWPGDVVTFINPTDRKRTITHRIVERADGLKRSVFTTKGDVNAAADSPISGNLIIGRQVASVPYLGRGVDFLRTVPGLLLIIWLPAIMVMISETRRLSDYYRSVRPYKYTGP